MDIELINNNIKHLTKNIGTIKVLLKTNEGRGLVYKKLLWEYTDILIDYLGYKLCSEIVMSQKIKGEHNGCNSWYLF